MSENRHVIDTRLIAVVALVLLVSLAGCSFLGGDSEPDSQEVTDETVDETDHPAILQRIVDSLEPERAASFKAAITVEEGDQLHSDGEQLLAQLEQIEELGTDQRDAVAVSIAERGSIDSETLATIDRVLASTEEFKTQAFRQGLSDSDGDGLLNGEVTALGLDSTGDNTRVTAFARQLSEDGFSAVELQFIEQVLDFSTLGWSQATYLDVQTTVESGSLSEDTLWKLEDASGDGLFNGMAREIGVDPQESHDRIADFARNLSNDGFESTEISFLQRVSTFSEFEWTQATHLGIENSIANGSVSEDTLSKFEDASGDGLFNGLAREIGVDPQNTHSQISDFARDLSEDGYDSMDMTFLQRVSTFSEFEWTQAERLDVQSAVEDGSISKAELSTVTDDSGDGLFNGIVQLLELSPSQSHPEVASVARDLGEFAFQGLGIDYLTRYSVVVNDPFAWEQAKYLEVTDPTRDGGLSTGDLDAISDDSGDGLLNAMAQELGLEQDTEHPDLAGATESLSQGGYDELEIAYIERLRDLRIYEGHKYEMWAQAKELGYFNQTIANGTVTERQRQYLWNNDSDRLLNGMERELGTDPQDPDTSGDGYADHLKWGPMQGLGLEVNPAQPDIYVEVDAADGTSFPSESQLESIERAFETEPSDEIGPINVHFQLCTVDVQPATEPEDMDDITEENRDMGGLGFHYLLINNQGFSSGGGTIQGQTLPRTNGTSWIWVDGTIEERFSEGYEAAVIAHELGHTLGLLDQFGGIDSWDYTLDEYYSVMNYNHNSTVTFSAGDPFNDYQEMANQSFGSYHQTTSRLEQMWENGTVGENALCEGSAG